MPASRRRPISRFIVMAILQAARARRLGLPLNSAFSWGLNRAIFIAAAKRGFGGGGTTGAPGGTGSDATAGASAHPDRELFTLGEDQAFRDTRRKELYFTIGEETQTEDDFARQVEARFASKRGFRTAWTEAEEIVAAAEMSDLTSGRRFYSNVYKPRRDELRERWTELPE